MNDLRYDELGDTPFKWIPAPAEAARLRRMRAVGALVLATACLSAGFLMGRLSGGRLPEDRQSQTTYIKPPAPVPASAPAQERAQGAAAGPDLASSPSTLALTSDPAPAPKTTPTESDPPVVLLNPGAADKGRVPDEQPSARGFRVPKVSNVPSPAASEVGRDVQTRDRPAPRDKRESANPGSERNYQALREYMLSR